MTENSEETPDENSGPEDQAPNDSQKAIRENLNNFLNPGFPVSHTPDPDPQGALKLRMAQMELANRMRLQQKAEGPSPNAPVNRRFPPGGFGSAQGVFHMRKGDFGKKPSAPSAAGRLSPYQKILSQSKQEKASEEAESDSEEVIEIPKDAEVKQNQGPKRNRAKRFRNPEL